MKVGADGTEEGRGKALGVRVGSNGLVSLVGEAVPQWRGTLMGVGCYHSQSVLSFHGNPFPYDYPRNIPAT